MNTTSRPTSIRVYGSSLVSSPYAPQFKGYTYNGDQKQKPAPTPVRVGRVCAVDGCAGVVKAKGFCDRHYQKHRVGAPLDVDRRRKPFDRSLCGTLRGARRHEHHKVPKCQPCRDARNGYDRARQAGDKERMKEYRDAGSRVG